MPVVELYFREYGAIRPGGRTLVLLHGLLGSSVNWHGIARELAARHYLLVPDLRNHGRSPHHSDAGYPAMASDLVALLDRRGIDSSVLIGHSMGAKVAMWLALQHPGRTHGLVAVDMAPVTYPNRFQGILSALSSVALDRVRGRGDADRMLQRHLDQPRVRQYLLQNLEIRDGRVRWRMNLEGLSAGIENLFAFPETAAGRQFLGPSLFLYGGESDYVTPGCYPSIRELFPFARLRIVPGAGHWVYANQPQAFLSAVSGFIRDA